MKRGDCEKRVSLRVAAKGALPADWDRCVEEILNLRISPVYEIKKDKILRCSFTGILDPQKLIKAATICLNCAAEIERHRAESRRETAKFFYYNCFRLKSTISARN